jgi:hypothetical protein
MKVGLKHWCFLLGSLAVFVNSFSQPDLQREDDLKLLADHVFYLSEVMLHDVISPPAASRAYAYALLGAYEAALYGKADLRDINGNFHVRPRIVPPVRPKNFNLSFSSNYAMLEVGRQIMPSGFLLEEKVKLLTAHFRAKKKLSDKDISQNIRYATDIARQVVAYARSDGYGKLSTYTRYTPKKQPGHWYPTPPAYMSAVEPQWKTIRPFFIDSAGQFAPPPPAAFSVDTTSSFYAQMKEVYLIGKQLTGAQKEIANFWDCNPFAVSFSGHMAIGLKKISPGGHWMGITGIACRKAELPLDSAIFVHTLVATTLHDAFISCWQEKFSSDRIRPAAAINQYLDQEWRPLLQTPPFPEYSSGHSVASSAAAVVLTKMLGDDFSFIDTSEVYFGLPERPFNSFAEAASEAAVSRVYGGIHFRDACEQGVTQGKRIGEYVLNALMEHQP